jgi:hypothetical protein
LKRDTVQFVPARQGSNPTASQQFCPFRKKHVQRDGKRKGLLLKVFNQVALIKA